MEDLKSYETRVIEINEVDDMGEYFFHHLLIILHKYLLLFLALISLFLILQNQSTALSKYKKDYITYIYKRTVLCSKNFKFHYMLV